MIDKRGKTPPQLSEPLGVPRQSQVDELLCILLDGSGDDELSSGRIHPSCYDASTNAVETLYLSPTAARSDDVGGVGGVLLRY